MQTAELIPVKIFCASHQIEVSFIHSLQESGLIELVIIEEDPFVHSEQLELLEKIVRLYYEMDINIEGIETISYLLQRINAMQREINELKNKIDLYETIG
ncbi:MAG: chaperone modulator CbpM [Chitinophagaceae bacterium]